jgi:SAM-dependent methyltransferase
MGLMIPIVDFLKTLDIEGEALFIGQQTTFGKDLGIKHRVLDQSDYEGADIVHDLGYPVSAELHGKFDFIYNGGCLDNMFNPAQAMMNFTQMLAPNGQIVCMESASSFNSAYLIYSLGWFYDYFEANRFKDWQIYLCSYRNTKELYYGPWKWFSYVHAGDRNGPVPQTKGNHLLVVSVARKGPYTTHDRQPLQYQYRGYSNDYPAPSRLWPKITDAMGMTLYKSKPYLRAL